MDTIRLRYLREKHKMKQEDVADRLGVARTTYVNYETGFRLPDLNTLKKIALIFDTTADYLLGLSDTESASPAYTFTDNITNTLQVPVLINISSDIETFFKSENIEKWETITNPGNYKQGELFFTHMNDGGMEPRIQKGDKLLIHMQSLVEYGEIAVAWTYNTAMIRRIMNQDNVMLLMPDNRTFPPILESKNILPIIGKVIQVQFKPEMQY